MKEHKSKLIKLDNIMAKNKVSNNRKWIISMYANEESTKRRRRMTNKIFLKLKGNEKQRGYSPTSLP